MAKRRLNSLSDLDTMAEELFKKVLVVRPLLRPYISESAVTYDYHVGHEFVITDLNSPLNDCRITVLDAPTLKRNYDVTHLQIKYNPGLAPTEIRL